MNKLLFALASASLMLATSSLAACSSDSADDGDDDTSGGSSSGGATSSSSSGGSSSSSGGSSSSSGGPTALNGCATFVDHTGDAAVEITWTNPTNDPDQCSRVKVGTVVTWKGNLESHPLTPQGGTTPSPITLTSSGTDKAITFDAAGDFGYVCTRHSIMTGVIQVVP